MSMLDFTSLKICITFICVQILAQSKKSRELDAITLIYGKFKILYNYHHLQCLDMKIFKKKKFLHENKASFTRKQKNIGNFKWRIKNE